MPRQPFTDVGSHVDSDALERDVLAWWKKEKIFEQTLEQTKDAPLFSFYDGPPYAQGKPHYGHVLQSAIKDTVLRYKTMRGYHVPRRVGWDTHGLPVEVFVEKELGLKTKQDIEAYGIDRFNAKCRETVFRYIDLWITTLKRLGRWASYEQGYATLNLPYMETEWWVFKQLWDQDLIYKDFRSTPYCIRCETPLSNFEVAGSYQDKVDTAVYIRFKVKEVDNLYLGVWTTTPWTLPGNVAVAINPKLTYVAVEHEGKKIVVAQDRVNTLFGNTAATKKISAKKLLSFTYEPVYAFLPAGFDATQIFRVVAGEHVTADDGTGLVHMAPAFGEEDAAIGKQEKLPTLRTVDTSGNFVADVTPWAGQNIFAANPSIVADLAARGLLLKQEQFKHSYPFCWRCDQPLIYYALDSWFVRIAALKETMLALNEKTEWIPAHVKQGRFGKGLASAPDWAISRNRYWSVPMPIWECDACHARECIGSVAELEQRAGVKNIEDIHRPMVDAYTWQCSACTGRMNRITEVLDVWFDAGSMPYAQWHYPFENKEFVAQAHPADFIVEAIEQTRLWFYVLHVLSAALTRKDVGLGTNQPAFKHAIGSGIIFAEDGRKLSKKLKNYPEIDDTLQQYGADTLRFYLLSSASLGEPYRFSEKDLQLLRRTTYLTLWNVYSFLVRYANTHQWQPGESVASEQVLDQWILARVHQLQLEVVRLMDAYHVDQAARHFIAYVDDLSNWYVRRSRSRFQKPATPHERDAAFGTLHEVMRQTCILLAPFMPFLAEAMYRNLQGGQSVHLQTVAEPSALTKSENEALEQMKQARTVVSVGLKLRAQAGIKIRQPLSRLVLAEKIPEVLREMIADELNVKSVTSGTVTADADMVASTATDGAIVGLVTTLTPELEQEGLAREIIRHGQALRREAGYALNDQIVLRFVTSDPKLQELLPAQPQVLTSLQVSRVETAVGTEDAGKDITLGDGTIHLGVLKEG